MPDESLVEARVEGLLQLRKFGLVSTMRNHERDVDVSVVHSDSAGEGLLECYHFVVAVYSMFGVSPLNAVIWELALRIRGAVRPSFCRNS